MGDQLKHEFSMEPVDTGRMTAPIQPQGIVPGESSSLATQGQPVTRPSFLQSFLANLGPAVAGGLASNGDPRFPFGTGLPGALGGIQQHNQQIYERGVQQQQLQVQQQQGAIRAAQEQANAAKIQAQIADYASKIENRGNLTGKAALAQQYVDQLSKGDTGGAGETLKQINSLATASAPAKPTSPWGKLSPEMAAVGVPPNPNDKEVYPLGQKDPKFQQDVQVYGGKVSALKQQNAMALQQARGTSFATSRAQYQMIPVLDKNNDNTLTYASAMDVAKDKSRYEPASQGASLGAKEAIFQDMNGASANLRSAYGDMAKNKETFSAGQIAKMTAAMRDDPSGGLLGSVIQNLTTAGAKEALTANQQKVAIAMLQNYENAFALRGVAGMGQSSDQLRGAIKATLPGSSSPPEYALKQLDAYDAQRERIHRGIPNVSVRGSSEGSKRRVIDLSQ